MTHPANDNQSSGTDLQPKEISASLLKHQSLFLNRINEKINRLNIQKKIQFGYTFALAIAMLGTLGSIAIGDSVKNHANDERVRVRRERQLLSDLRSDTLSLQAMVNFQPSLQKSKNFQQAKSIALNQIANNRNLFNKINHKTNNSSNPSFKHLFIKYTNAYLDYINNLEKVLNQIDIKALETRGYSRAKELFSELATTNTAQETQEFLSQLVGAIEIAEKQEEKTETSLINAQIIRVLIIVIGTNISIALAYFFIRHAGNVIACPISTITKVAHKAAQKSDFSLQVPVTTSSDLAILADSLNQLINRLKELIKAQKEAEIAADNANKSKNKFLANMSHELRTPLNGILGYAQILARSHNLSEEQKHGISTIYQCGFHLLNLINDILDISKIEAQKLELRPIDFHLPSFVQGVVETCRIQAEQKGIEFIYLPPPNLPVGVNADKKRLRQVLINLLSNAIKFTDTGCVKLQVLVTNAQKPSHVSINFTVVDTGVGMSSQQIEKIFLPFEQVIDSDSKAGGTGLGLTISQKIIEMMGSSIQVKSQEGVGSLFEFKIDLPVAEDWTESSTITSRGKIIGYSGARKKILVVDDYWENRSFLISLLEPLNFTVIEASNGKEGLEKASQYLPDLIISDTNMPVIDGWEMLSKIRASEMLRDMIVVLASPTVNEFERLKGLSAGANYFLTRPVQTEELYNLLTKQLKINWTYASLSIESSEEAITVTTNEMIIPPASDLTMLLEYVRKGQIKGIKQELDKISRMDAKYHIFVKQLSKYAKNLNIQKIRSFIQEYIRN